MAYNPDLAIDVEKVVNARMKNGKKCPKFIIRFLERFIHIDMINEIITQGYEGQEFLEYAVKCMDVKINMEGLDELELVPGRKYTFVSNHPLGGIDGVILASQVGRLFPGQKVRFQVNDFLMNIPGIADLSIPINKMGAQSRDLPRLINEYYASDDQLMLFPSGMCSRKIKGEITDLEWHKTFVQKSVQNDRYIVPIHFFGQNSKRFYRVAKICDKLKFKFNPAMAFLPDEMFRGKGKTYRAVVGKPIAPEFFDKSKTCQEWAKWVREEVYKLN